MDDTLRHGETRLEMLRQWFDGPEGEQQNDLTELSIPAQRWHGTRAGTASPSERLVAEYDASTIQR